MGNSVGTKFEDQKPTEGDLNLSAQIKALRNELERKADDLQHMESLNKTLTMRDYKSNSELQEARKELINVWPTSSFAACLIKPVTDFFFSNKALFG